MFKIDHREWENGETENIWNNDYQAENAINSIRTKNTFYYRIECGKEKNWSANNQNIIECNVVNEMKDVIISIMFDYVSSLISIPTCS